MIEVKQVRIVLRSGWEMALPFVNVKWECPECGKKMGEPFNHNFCENDDWYNCDRWNNSCGHIATYETLQVATKGGFKSWKVAKEEGQSLNEFCIDAISVDVDSANKMNI